MAFPDDPTGVLRADGVATHRRLERLARERLGLPPGTLMERAGEAARRILRRHWPGRGEALVLCGPGNNGGDGYTLARRLLETGGRARVLAWAEPATAEARSARDRFREAGGGILPREDLPAFLAAGVDREETVFVDALFGLGLSRSLDRETAGLLERLAACTTDVLALDVPSGLDAETGVPKPVALPARVTVAFLSAAPGHLTGAAPRYVGLLEVDDLGTGELLAGIPPDVDVLARRLLPSLLSPRPPDAHKGLGGHVLVAGGGIGLGGAVRLAGEAALRAGAGLVTALTRPEHVAGVLAGCPSLMVRGVLRPGPSALRAIPADVIALGPGLGRDAWGRALWALLVRDPRPLVLDADGLNLLAETPVVRRDWILTPHPGEAARLLGTTAAEVQSRRYEAARELARRYGASVVLKGNGTILARPEGALAVAPYALAALATAGTGDLLTGVIAGLRAAGLAEAEAAAAGVLLHLEAGRRAARVRPRGVISADVLAEIGR